MLRSNYIFVMLVLASQFLFPLQYFACPSDEKSLEKSKQIWEQAIFAKGGRDKILNITNLLTYDKKKTSVGFRVFPDKYWWWTKDKEPIGTNVALYDYRKNIAYTVKNDLSPFSFPLTNQPKELILSRLLPDLLETKWIQPKLLGAATKKINGKEFDVVCVEISYSANQKLKTDRHDYLFDQQTHLLFQDIEYVGKSKFTTEYSNYIDVKGIKFSRENKSKFDYARKWNVGEYIIEVDIDYREDLFDNPPTIKDGPDAWKKKP